MLGTDIRLLEYVRLCGSCRAVYSPNSATEVTDSVSVIYNDNFDTWYVTDFTTGKTTSFYGDRTTEKC